MRWGLLSVVCGLLVGTAAADDLTSIDHVPCEGSYKHHLQGICTNDADVLYWSFTTELVKTDLAGKVQKKVPVANHHGDLCFHEDRLYVAVNLGKFNDPAGNADSWVYVYDADSLELLAKHETQEAMYGAGGIGVMNGHFFVVGGLPDGVPENYVYEYDENLAFVKRHVVASGWTKLGIQTAAFHDNCWWFGCYGAPQILLKTDAEFGMLGRYTTDVSLGVVGVAPGRFLTATGPRTADRRCEGIVHQRVPDGTHGLKLLAP